MRNIESTSALTEPVSKGVLTIGNFDGIHRGHQLILSEVVRRARTMGGTSVVMSFDPPPGRVLGRQLAPQVMTMPDRARLARALGVDIFITQPFTLELAHMTPLEFVEGILEAYIRPKVILVGYDFCFGRERQGDVHFLRAYYEPKGVEVFQLGPFALSTASGSVETSTGAAATGAQGESASGEVVSSSAIRRLVQAGEVERAAIMLGRPHLLSGRVVHGEARGRTIGFPTANIESETELLPATGVYATWLWVDGIRRSSVTNVGMRPTFAGNTLEGQKLTIEAHVLDFSGDLYGKHVRLELVSRLRGEQKFAGLDALKAQIARDVAEARLRVGGGSGEPADTGAESSAQSSAESSAE